MTQIVTKAKEMGTFTASKLVYYKLQQKYIFFLYARWWFDTAAYAHSSDDCFLVLSDLSRTYTQDGVCLTESGLCQLQSLSATASRRRKPKPKLKLKIINQNSVAVLQAPVDPLSEHSRDEDMEDNRGTCLLAQASSFISDFLLQAFSTVVTWTINVGFCVCVCVWCVCVSPSLTFNVFQHYTAAQFTLKMTKTDQIFMCLTVFCVLSYIVLFNICGDWSLTLEVLE